MISIIKVLSSKYVDSSPSFTSSMNPSYPSIELLAKRAKQRMPGFAYDYLAGGCMAEVNLHKNTSDIRAVELRPRLLA